MSTLWTPNGFASSTLTSQIRGAEAISVNTAFSFPSQLIYIGATGNATITMQCGDSVQFTNIPAGAILPFVATKITAATASSMVALY